MTNVPESIFWDMKGKYWLDKLLVKAKKLLYCSGAAIQELFSFFLLLIPLASRQSCLRSSQPCNGNAEGRTADIIQPDHVEELDAIGIASMLATDTQFQVRVRFATLLNRHVY